VTRRASVAWFPALAAAVALASIVLPGPARVSAQQPPVFRTSTEAVAVGVSVRRNGRPVSDLRIEDFALTDNGVAQRLDGFGYGQLPLDVTVVLDVSGSVTGYVIDQLRKAVTDVRKDLEPQDQLRVVTFSMRVRRLLDFETSPSIDTAFEAIAPGGGSAVRDALAVALTSGRASTERRDIVILFTDGRDSSSVTTPAGLMAVARSTSPTVSVVLATPARVPSDQIYTDLASETGGTVVSLLPTDSLGGSLRRALAQFRASYVLTYVPDGVERTGAHAIEVVVKQPGVDVRARRGYFVR
jgi:VWFA-related protein